MSKNAFSTSSVATRASVKRRMIALIILLLITATLVYPAPYNRLAGKINSKIGKTFSLPLITRPFVLGLDLQGGTRLEYEADISKIDASEQKGALEGVRDVIERRVNAMGVSEPVVQIAKAGDDWRLSVELAGIRDINQAIKTIGETPILEFKEGAGEGATLSDEQRKILEETNAAADKAAADALNAAKKDPAKFETLIRATSQDEATKAKGGDLGFIKENPDYLEIYDLVKSTKPGTVYKDVVRTPRLNAVVKVEESKPAGTEVKAYHILMSYSGASSSFASSTKAEAQERIQLLKKQATPKNFIDLAKKNSQEPGASESGGDLGWFGKGVMVQPFEDATFKMKTGAISDIIETQFGYHLIYKVDERPLNDVRVRATFFKKMLEADLIQENGGWVNTKLTGKNLKRASLDLDQQTGNVQVAISFDDEGTKLFADITRRNLNKPVAIFLDGQIISAPTVESEIMSGQAVISGRFSVLEAKQLAQRLNAGALPVPISLIAQQSVGPSLGMASVQSSLIAGLYGFLLVAIFMIAFYRVPGLLAVITLGLYGAVSLAIFKVLPVTLTLAGMAGFVFSIGIAVDANVLVFERLKEELREGKSLRNALEDAFRRAWPSIRDGNLTTLISCFVLYNLFSSSLIRGFALTLAIGILLSMFSAITATRIILRFAAGFDWANNHPWLFLGSKKSTD